MWNGRHVSDDRVDRDLRFVGVSEILAPRVDLFLPRGVPWHFAAERIWLALPVVGPRFHRRFKLRRFFRLSLRLEVVENRDEDIAFHLAKLRQVRSETGHSQRSLKRLIQIPIPWMIL